MAMIAMTNKTSKLTIARPKSLSFHAGIEAAGLSPSDLILTHNGLGGQRLGVCASGPPSSSRSTILAKFSRSSLRFRSGLERTLDTVSPTAPPGGSE